MKTPKDTDPFIARSPEKILQAQLQELVCYLWDNYIQLYDNATEIFLMGVGNAYLGVKLLLMNRGTADLFSFIYFLSLRPLFSAGWSSLLTRQPKRQLTNVTDCKDRISGVVNFVTGTLRPIKSDVDQDLSAWYKDHSRVYITSDHACWQNEDLTRKVQKRRFGTVKRSPVHGLGKMLQHHADEAKEFIMEIIDNNAGDTTEEDKHE